MKAEQHITRGRRDQHVPDRPLANVPNLNWPNTSPGAATSEAFWGVGGLKSDLANDIVQNSTISTSGPAAINTAAGVALHAAVGCLSSVAGGAGRCPAASGN